MLIHIDDLLTQYAAVFPDSNDSWLEFDDIQPSHTIQLGKLKLF